jgi:hypothetical protein
MRVRSLYRKSHEGATQMDAYTYGIQSQEPTGSIIVRIVGESEQTAALRLSSAIAGAKVAFFRLGKEPGRRKAATKRPTWSLRQCADPA